MSSERLVWHGLAGKDVVWRRTFGESRIPIVNDDSDGQLLTIQLKLLEPTDNFCHREQLFQNPMRSLFCVAKSQDGAYFLSR